MRTDMFHRGIFVTTDGIEEEMPCQAALFNRETGSTDSLRDYEGDLCRTF